MAWGTTGLTEDGEKPIGHYPVMEHGREANLWLFENRSHRASRDSYDPGRLVQVFRVEPSFPACNLSGGPSTI